jgi:hypothetical protein
MREGEAGIEVEEALWDVTYFVYLKKIVIFEQYEICIL